MQPTRKGLQVRGIKPNSVGDRLGLKTGDVLLEVNGKKVTNTQAIAKALQRWSNKVTVTVMRDGEKHTATLEQG